jgi:hypothetical protein
MANSSIIEATKKNLHQFDFFEIGNDNSRNIKPGNPYLSGRLSTIDLLALTGLHLLLLMLQTLFAFLHNKIP